MKTIPLTQGQFAIVDDADYLFLSQFRWHAIKAPTTWYAGRNAKTKTGFKYWRMHWDITGKHSDHRNGNGLDNRRENLRVCTQTENTRNQRRQPTAKTPYKGVKRHVYRFRTMWESQITVNGKKVYLGLFDSPEMAARAYNVAACQHFGEYACLNMV